MPMAGKKPLHAAEKLSLPPAYTLIAIREAGDAFKYAMAIEDKSAGTLVWARRFQLAEFAVVLEPPEPLSLARTVFFAAMNALADTLVVYCPPEKPVAFEWPDTLLLDAGVIGGGRMGCPEDCGEADIPDWLVFGGMLRTAGHHLTEPGEWMRGVALSEEGIWDVHPGEIVESFARHLMSALHNWQVFGPQHELSRWAARWRRPPTPMVHMDTSGNFCRPLDAKQTEKRPLAEALLSPQWLDEETAEPWL